MASASARACTTCGWWTTRCGATAATASRSTRESAALQATTHHIYVGRNTSHHNKQSGFWTKQAVDVIFSQNVAYAHYVQQFLAGRGHRLAVRPVIVWFIVNHI